MPSLLLPGQSHGSKGVAPLLSNLPLSALLSKPVRGMAAQRVAGAERPAGIPGKASRKEQRAWEGEACTWRHRIENCFAGSKEYGGVPPGMTTPPAALPATWHRVALPLPSRYTPLGHWHQPVSFCSTEHDPDLSATMNQLQKMAPRTGFEPVTNRLTVDRSTAELPRNTGKSLACLLPFQQPFFAGINQWS